MNKLAVFETLPLIKNLPLSSRERQILGFIVFTTISLTVAVLTLLIIWALATPSEISTKGAAPLEEPSTQLSEKLRRKAYKAAAKEATRRSDISTAIKYTEYLRQTDPAHKAYHLFMAQLLLQVNRHEDARRVLTYIIQNFENSSSAETLYASALPTKELLDSLNSPSFFALIEDDSHILKTIGCRIYSHDYTITEKLGTALRSKNNHSSMGIFLTSYSNFKKEGATAKQLRSIETMLHRTPLFHEGHLLRGKILLEKERYKDAARALSTAVHLKPEDVKTNFLLGTLYFSHLDTPIRAANYFETVRATDSLHWQSNYNLGILYLKEGRPRGALPYFYRALQRSPDTRLVRYQIGAAYEKSEQIQKAIDTYKAILEEHPLDKLALHKIRFLKSN
ncbi:tetratricopeptide repeat protein [Chitinivibrio alkaliphilus]|uniref:Uncharacterized protein n=1 Tax=Chitinivibrio alkaliphilus ACht1 TaxID=1313304 RepID=U7D8Z3_9BACT|nr:tetratricopeptide repeat protein [Chitinivibrio alkaliphilus]ERP32056.1 hypothetical protein CALK_1039 [Chitinivibrio alkaliphilus ACht1]